MMVSSTSDIYNRLKRLQCPLVRELSPSFAAQVLYKENDQTRLLIMLWLYNKILDSSGSTNVLNDSDDVEELVKHIIDIAVKLGMCDKHNGEVIVTGRCSMAEQIPFWQNLLDIVECLLCSAGDISNNSQVENGGENTSLKSSSVGSNKVFSLDEKYTNCCLALQSVLSSKYVSTLLPLCGKAKRSCSTSTSSDISVDVMALQEKIVEAQQMIDVEKRKLSEARNEPDINDSIGQSSPDVSFDEITAALDKVKNFVSSFAPTYDTQFASLLVDDANVDDRGLGEKYHKIHELILKMHHFCKNMQEINMNAHSISDCNK